MIKTSTYKTKEKLMYEIYQWKCAARELYEKNIKAKYVLNNGKLVEIDNMEDSWHEWCESKKLEL